MLDRKLSEIWRRAGARTCLWRSERWHVPLRCWIESSARFGGEPGRGPACGGRNVGTFRYDVGSKAQRDLAASRGADLLVEVGTLARSATMLDRKLSEIWRRAGARTCLWRSERWHVPLRCWIESSARFGGEPGRGPACGGRNVGTFRYDLARCGAAHLFSRRQIAVVNFQH